MGPWLMLYMLRGVAEHLDRLQGVLLSLQMNLETKAKGNASPLVALADLCSDEAARIYEDFLCPVIKELEASCALDTAPLGGAPGA